MGNDNSSASPEAETEKINRNDNFVSRYANNVLFEGNAWDLKIKFGQVETVSGETRVKATAEISIPWAQAKLAIYWLRLQVEAMEIQSGKIALRKDVLPPELPEPEVLTSGEPDPDAVRMHEFAKKVRAEFFANL
jgi:hypothetical protein